MDKSVSVFFLVLLLSSCGPEVNTSSPTASSDSASAVEARPLTLAWVLDTQEDSLGLPHTQVALAVNGRTYPIAEALAIEEIDAAAWANYKIPPTALLASGGWWAGSGTYYYVQRSGDDLEVLVGYNDEEMEPDAAFQYKTLQRIPVSASDGVTASQEPPAAGRHCFQYHDAVLTLDVDLVLDEHQQVTGSQRGVISDDDEGYYTSYESSLAGHLDGENLRLHVTTRIEEDTQEEEAVWTWRDDRINDGQHLLEAVACPAAN